MMIWRLTKSRSYKFILFSNKKAIFYRKNDLRSIKNVQKTEWQIEK